LDIPINLKWKQDAITVAGGNSKGTEPNKLNIPIGLSFDDENNLYIADYESSKTILLLLLLGSIIRLQNKFKQDNTSTKQ